MKKTLKKYSIAVFKNTNILLLAVGIATIVLYEYIENYLAWVVGSTTIVVGLYLLIYCLINLKVKKNMFLSTSSLVFIVLGTVIMCTRENAIGLIMIIWGFLGVSKGGYRIFEFLYCNNKKNAFKLAELALSLADATLGVMLMVNPFQQVRLHIIILGVELILMSFKTVTVDDDCDGNDDTLDEIVA